MSLRIGDLAAIPLSDNTFAYFCFASPNSNVWVYDFRTRNLVTDARAFDPSRLLVFAYSANVKKLFKPLKIRVFPLVQQIELPTMKLSNIENGQMVYKRMLARSAGYPIISEEEAAGLQDCHMLMQSADPERNYDGKLQKLLEGKPVYEGAGDVPLAADDAPFLKRRGVEEAKALEQYEREELARMGKPIAVVELEIAMPVTGDPDQRDTIEEALNDALEAADAGLVSGGEIGPDMCSLTVEATKQTKAKALTIIRSVLKKNGCPEGTTITELGEEPVAHPLVAPKKGKTRL